MYFDTHAHFDSRYFDGDRDAVLGSMQQAGVELIVDPGCDLESSRKAIEIAERWPFVYAAVGWHPEHAEHFDETGVAQLRDWLGHARVCAIGEIGLDYYYKTPPRQTQKQAFIRQLELAVETGYPVIIHDREAHGDCLEIVKEFPTLRGVFHCFSGSAEFAEELTKRGWYLGFTGVVTFKNARRVLEAARTCPLERLLLETDAPYMAPEPYRGKRADSRMLPRMAEAIGAVRGMPAEEIARVATENGKRLFSLA